METLDFILKKYNLETQWYDPNNQINYSLRMPLEIPNMGRDDLPDLFNELGFTLGAEIGVESGAFSNIILKKMPKVMLSSIDPWKSYRAYRDHTSQSKLDQFYEDTREVLRPYGFRSVIIRKSSEEALAAFKDNSLDFVYIDANHSFTHVAFDIHNWLKKVRPGGIISGHDYKKHREGVNIHVKQIVDAYTDAYFIRPWFVIGRTAKIEGEARDDNRSFMWIKTK